MTEDLLKRWVEKNTKEDFNCEISEYQSESQSTYDNNVFDEMEDFKLEEISLEVFNEELEV